MADIVSRAVQQFEDHVRPMNQPAFLAQLGAIERNAHAYLASLPRDRPEEVEQMALVFARALANIKFANLLRPLSIIPNQRLLPALSLLAGVTTATGYTATPNYDLSEGLAYFVQLLVARFVVFREIDNFTEDNMVTLQMIVHIAHAVPERYLVINRVVENTNDARRLRDITARLPPTVSRLVWSIPNHDVSLDIASNLVMALDSHARADTERLLSLINNNLLPVEGVIALAAFDRGTLQEVIQTVRLLCALDSDLLFAILYTTRVFRYEDSHGVLAANFTRLKTVVSPVELRIVRDQMQTVAQPQSVTEHAPSKTDARRMLVAKLELFALDDALIQSLTPLIDRVIEFPDNRRVRATNAMLLAPSFVLWSRFKNLVMTTDQELVSAYINIIGDLSHVDSIMSWSHYVRGPYRNIIAQTICLLHNNRIAQTAMALQPVDLAAEAGRLMETALSTMTGVQAASLPREHGERLKFVMEMFGLDTKQPFALSRDTIEQSVQRIARALSFESHPHFSAVCLIFVASNILGTLATNLQIQIAQLYYEEGLEIMPDLPEAWQQTFIPRDMPVSIAQQLFSFKYMTESLPEWIVELRIIQGALVSPQASTLASSTPNLSLDENVYRSLMGMIRPVTPTTPWMDRNRLLDIDAGHFRLLASLEDQVLDLWPNEHSFLLARAAIVLLQASALGPTMYDDRLRRAMLYNATTGELVQTIAHMHSSDQIHCLRVMRMNMYEFNAKRDAQAFFDLVKYLESQEQVEEDDINMIGTWLHRTMGLDMIFAQAHRKLDPESFFLLVDELIRFQHVVPALYVLSYPGELKVDRFQTNFYAQTLARDPFWKAARLAMEATGNSMTALAQATARLTAQQQTDLVKVVAQANKIDALQTVLGSIVKDAARAQAFTLPQLVTLLSRLDADQTTVMRIALNFAPMTEQTVRQAIESSQPLHPVVLLRIVRTMKPLVETRQMQQQLSSNIVYWMERSVEAPDVPVDVLNEIVGVVCRDILLLELVQPLGEQWFRSLQESLRNIVVMPVEQGKNALGRVLSLFSTAHAALSRRGASFDASSVYLSEEFRRAAKLAPISDRYVFLWSYAVRNQPVRQTLRINPVRLAAGAIVSDAPKILSECIRGMPQDVFAMAAPSLANAFLNAEPAAHTGDIAKILVDVRADFPASVWRSMIVNLALHLQQTKLTYLFAHGAPMDREALDALFKTALLYDRVDVIRYLFSIGFMPTAEQTFEMFESVALNGGARTEIIRYAAQHGAPIGAVPPLGAANQLEPLRVELTDMGRFAAAARVPLDPVYARQMDALLSAQMPMEMDGVAQLAPRRLAVEQSADDILVKSIVAPVAMRRGIVDPDKIEWLSIIYKTLAANEALQRIESWPVHDATVHKQELGDLAVYDPMAEYKESLASSSAPVPCDVCGTVKRSLYSFYCNPSHVACLVCWFEHAHAQLSAGLMRCVAPKCQALTRSQISFVCDRVSAQFDSIRPLFESFELSREMIDVVKARLLNQLDIFVPDRPQCPVCKGDAAHSNKKSLFLCVNAECQTPFCGLCKQMAHSPFDCADWARFVSEATGVEGLDARDVTKCPFCKYQQERVRGTCNKIVCGQNTHATHVVARQGCGKVYCFVCKQAWEGHTDYYRCTQVVQDTEGDERLLDQFKDMAAIDSSNEVLATFETAVATGMARSQPIPSGLSADERELYIARTLVPRIRSTLETSDPRYVAVRRQYLRQRQMYRQLMMVLSLTLAMVKKYHPNADDDAQVRIMRGFVLNTMQFVETLWERYIRLLQTNDLTRQELLDASFVQGFLDTFVMIDRVLSDPECDAFVQRLAEQMTKDVAPALVRGVLDGLAEFIGPHCQGVLMRQKDSLAQAIIGRKEERCMAAIAEAIRPNLAEGVAWDDARLAPVVASFGKDTVVDSLQRLALQSVIARAWESFVERAVHPMAEVGLRVMNVLDWRRSFYSFVAATKLEQTDVSVVDRHFEQSLDESLNSFLPVNSVDMALRDMGWFVTMFPFDRCIERVRETMRDIERHAASRLVSQSVQRHSVEAFVALTAKLDDWAKQVVVEAAAQIGMPGKPSKQQQTALVEQIKGKTVRLRAMMVEALEAARKDSGADKELFLQQFEEDESRAIASTVFDEVIGGRMKKRGLSGDREEIIKRPRE